MARIVTVTSGKGGVGKTNVSTNLSCHLSSLGYKPCIFDADLGLANINILLGINPEHTLEDVLYNNIDLSDIIIKDCYGIDIIPGSTGVEDIANINQENLDKLIQSFTVLDDYDFLFIDTAAGISNDIISFCLASNEIIIVITPEPTSLTDAYALLKVLTNNGFNGYVRIIVNQCKNTAIAKKTYTGFKEVVIKYLSLKVQPLGVILEDSNIPQSVREQKPFIHLFPETVASKCLKVIAKNLIEGKNADLKTHDLNSFWKRCIDNFKNRLNLKEKDGVGTAGITQTHEHREINNKPVIEPAIEPETKPDIEPEKEEILTEEKYKTQHDFKQPEDQSTHDLIKELIASVSSVSTEIKNLRDSLNGNSNRKVISDSTNINSADTENIKGEIVLDLDGFLQKRKQ